MTAGDHSLHAESDLAGKFCKHPAKTYATVTQPGGSPGNCKRHDVKYWIQKRVLKSDTTFSCVCSNIRSCDGARLGLGGNSFLEGINGRDRGLKEERQGGGGRCRRGGSDR